MRKPKPEAYLLRMRALTLYLQRLVVIREINEHRTRYGCDFDETKGARCFLWLLSVCTHVFPRSWRFNDAGRAYLVSDPNLWPVDAFQKFFGTDDHQTCALFMPGYAYEPFGIEPMKEDADAGIIAHRMHWFIIGREKELGLMENKKSLL